MRCAIVPPGLLETLARTAPADLAETARRTLLLDTRHRPGPRRTMAPPRATPGLDRTISDAHHTEQLPGDVVRREGAPDTGDLAVDEAYTGLGATYRLYWEAYHRDSIDGSGEPLDATVHYGQSYDNAFWNGQRMVFGDGDGRVFGRFTRPLDVVGHELTHGVTEHDAGLVYADQAGALNESISDVFGSLVKQHALGQTADQADWLIGAGLFTPAVHGVALRSMKAPGTAYDDPLLGKDPQPATMSGYVTTTADNGGVHINSGIPNHAFYLTAVALGGHAWERAGLIWYETLRDPALARDSDFTSFARLTVSVASRVRDSAAADAVRRAWQAVEVPV